eukprot:GHRR01008502.1.p1 GENE.GHRR01008502.1~~GHRR01008502.1.p1  ORF type:complete len:295 (+),score=84.07 GHRR01008502.1:188-1072(+)
MGQNQSAPGGGPPGAPGEQKKKDQEKKKKWEPPAPPPRVGKKQRKRDAQSGLGSKLPTVTPNAKCKLRLLKLERIKDYLLMEHEFVQNQEQLKPQDERNEEDRSKVDDLRGSPLSVGTLEEIIDENHAIVSSTVGPEYYVGILSFVDKTQLEPGCSVLLHNKVMSVVGILQDETDPMVSVMKVDKAPLESYADVGGLEQQVQEIKEAVELPLTNPELYEDIGIKPPKVCGRWGLLIFDTDCYLQPAVTNSRQLQLLCATLNTCAEGGTWVTSAAAPPRPVLKAAANCFAPVTYY